MSVRFNENVFEKIKKMVTDNSYVSEENESVWLKQDCYQSLLGNTSVSNGSDYDGFWNFTDGFVEQTFYFDPIRDGSGSGFRFSGVNPHSNKRAEFMNKYLDELCKPDSALSSYWFDNIRDTELQERWKTEEEFIKWYNNFIPYESHFEQLDLFTGKPTETKLHKEDDKFYEKVQQDYVDCWFSESPAFIKIKIYLYDEDNRHGSGDRRCIIHSCFNDDFNYGRERVGSWAGKGWTGEGIGDHNIYSASFKWKTSSELYRKLKPRLEKAYQTVC